jgi:hypothetical protein
MDRLMYVFGLLLAIALPIGIVAGVMYDLQHPELWDTDWLHDPRRYWPYMAVGSSIIVLIVLVTWRDGRRHSRRMAILDDIEACRIAGKLDEAQELFRIYKRHY